jgi:uncharacterized repeat protein (TIGR04076 family)
MPCYQVVLVLSARKQSAEEPLLRLRDNWEEPVSFSIKVVGDGNCRAEHKKGQRFEFSWKSPEGLCTESLVGMYPVLHSMRVFGDMRELGSSERNVRVYNCPSREIKFRIEALYKCNICGKPLQVSDDGIQSHQLYCAKPDFPLRVCDTCYTEHKDKRIEW